MSIVKEITACLAAILPIAASIMVGIRLWKSDRASWQITACFSALVMATSMILLAAAERISFVRYGDAVVQVNEKLEETRRLTEQNKQIAQKTIAFVLSATANITFGGGYERSATRQSETELLKAAGLSDKEVQDFYNRANQPGSRTNSP